MTDARFIQIHWLTSYPGVLLNRDESGLAKRLPFGNAVRGRVSSQCLKRHIRLAGSKDLEGAKENPWALQNVGVPTGLRTKTIVEERILPRAKELHQGEVAAGVTEVVEKILVKELYGDKAEDIKKRQALFFGEPEIEYLAEQVAEALKLEDSKAVTEFFKDFAKNQRANMRQLKNGAGLESALFGRMVTSDPASNKDAAIHVAHALTIHGIARELDFVTAVDDLKNRDEGDDSGAAGVFDAELTSGLYYGYAVIDVPLLISNLSNDTVAAGAVLQHLIHLIAQTSPGAKKGSTAPYAWAEFILVESGKRQPRTLANAFRDAVETKDGRVLERGVERIEEYLMTMDGAYGQGEERRQLAISASLAAVEKLPLDKLGEWAAGLLE